MKLRPHHILCIMKFTGHGYSAEFTAHMASIVSELSDFPDTHITVAQGCDDVCKECPNNIGGVCSSREKTVSLDAAVLKICSLACGDTLPWRELAYKARERIFKTDGFDNICACCQWFELCRNTEVCYE